MQITEKGKENAIPVYNNRNCGQNLSADSSNKPQKLKNYGVDKLAISLDYGSGFAYPKGEIPKNWGKVENTHQKTKEVQTKYFRNEMGFNATIETFRDQEYLRISLNPSKAYSSYMLTTDTNLISNQLENIKRELITDNIHIDFEQAKLTRLDVAHNIKLDYELSHYQNVFDSFQGKRQIKKQHSDSRYWGNGQNQYIIYNKTKEVIDNDKEIPEGISRGEMRLLSKDCIMRVFGDNKLGNIISVEEPYIEKYNNYVNDNIFRQKQCVKLELDFGDIYNIYQKLYPTYKNKSFAMAMKSMGILKLIEQPNGMDNMIKVIKEFHKERTARRHIAELNLLANIWKTSLKQDNSFITLNNEVKEKLIIKPNYLIAV